MKGTTQIMPYTNETQAKLLVESISQHNDKLDKLLKVTTRTATQVESLVDCHLDARLIVVETRCALRQKRLWSAKKIAQWVVGVAISAGGLILAWLHVSP